MKSITIGIIVMAMLIVYSHCDSENRAGHVFPPDIMGNESLFRPALAKRFPKLETKFYHFDGHMVFALLRKKGTNNYLFIILPDPIGNVDVQINGKKVNPLKNPAKLKIATGSHPDNGGGGYDFSNPKVVVIGGWLTLKPKDKFTVKAEVIYPIERELFAEFTPPYGTKTWMKPLSAKRVREMKKKIMEMQ